MYVNLCINRSKQAEEKIRKKRKKNYDCFYCYCFTIYYLIIQAGSYIFSLLLLFSYVKLLFAFNLFYIHTHTQRTQNTITRVAILWLWMMIMISNSNIITDDGDGTRRGIYVEIKKLRTFINSHHFGLKTSFITNYSYTRFVVQARQS